jgi:hypothetical protein
MEKKLIKEAFRLQTLAGLNPISEVKIDHDGDGEFESPEKEYKGSVDRAIKNTKKAKKGVDECWECDQEDQERDFTRGHDHEGRMAYSELKSLQSNASRLVNIIGDENAQLPGWVSSYISLAADYINSVTDYLAAMEPETEEPSNY